jgi:hypothetical protein
VNSSIIDVPKPILRINAGFAELEPEVSGFDSSLRYFTERTETCDVSESGCQFRLHINLAQETVVAVRAGRGDVARTDVQGQRKPEQESRADLHSPRRKRFDPGAALTQRRHVLLFTAEGSEDADRAAAGVD